MPNKNVVVLSTEPKGVFTEGTVGATALYPGQCVQIDVSAGIDDSGRFTFEPYAPGTSGLRPVGPLYYVREHQNGKGIAEAYAVGSRVHLYCPVMGDEMNFAMKAAATTALGTVIIPETGTGNHIATTGTPEIESGVAMEVIASPTARQLCFGVFSGY